MSTGLPERRQLMHLLDRAQRHVLTPAEARLLRAGVERLLDGLTELPALLADLGAAQDERDQALREVGAMSPLVVSCPLCKAGPGSRCRAARGVQVPEVPHRRRLEAAGRRLIAEALGGEAS